MAGAIGLGKTLRAQYQNGAPGDWQQRFFGAYAKTR
jgi:hypothetical protein